MLDLIPPISMTETLFGGLLLAALLFFASRRLGLSAFWAGIFSALLPFLLYLVYASRHWGGGDVLAIHFALYLANAGVLVVFSGLRQKKTAMHWAPKLIIGFFIGLVAVNAALLSIAGRGLPDRLASLLLPNPDKQRVHTTFPGTVPHDPNKSYQDHLARVEQQRALGWQVTLQGLDALESHRSARLELHLLDKNGAPVSQADVRAELWRIANSRDDQQLRFEESAPGLYRQQLNLPDAGRWLLEIVIQKDGYHYRQQHQLFLDD